MIGMVGLLIAVAVIVFLIWKNWHMAVVSLVGALIVILFNGMDAPTALTEHFMSAMSSFAGSWFLLFLLGAVFGKVMGDSGASVGIASSLVKKMGKKSVVLVIMITSLVLSYGGIGTFIIAFSVYPIAVALFKDADIPKKLLPATIMVMPVTLCMTMLPGSPSNQNIIPTATFGTDVYAAPVMGVICSVFMFAFAWGYLNIQVKKAQEKGEHFIASPKETVMDLGEETIRNLPPVWQCYLPIIILLVCMFALKNVLSSLYAVSVGMTLAILAGCILFRDKFNSQEIICEGTANGLGTLIATSSIMGFGGVVQASPAFQSCVDFLFSLKVGPMVSSVIAINVIAAITGSSAGGLNIFLNTMGQYLVSSGINPQMLHRVVAIASSGLDAMPHASGIVVCNQIADTKQEDTYIHVFVTCALFPLLTCMLAILLGTIGIV